MSNDFRASVGAQWVFLSDAGRKVQKDLDIQEYTDPHNDQAHWANEMPYYRCRFPAEYALANKITQPRNVFVREGEVLPGPDAWLGTQFAPQQIGETSAIIARRTRRQSRDLPGTQPGPDPPARSSDGHRRS